MWINPDNGMRAVDVGENSMLDALLSAVAFTDGAMPVCLLEPKGKAPATTHGLHDAVSAAADPAFGVIPCIYHDYPTLNFGLVGGAVAVIDIDNHGRANGHGFVSRWQDEHGALADTLTVATGSDGLHLYYLLPPARVGTIKSKSTRHGVDVKASGGYVVGAGSVHPNGNMYRWLHSPCVDGVEMATAGARELALIDYLIGADTAHAPARHIDNPFTVPTQSKIKPYNGTIHAGCRNDVLFRYASAIRGAGATDSELAALVSDAAQNHCVPPFPSRDAAAIVARVLRYAGGGAA